MQINSDADGVCLDFTSGLHDFMLNEVGVKASELEPLLFDYSNCYPYTPNLIDRIKDFVNSRDYFSKIKAYPEAIEALTKYKNQINGEIRIITACGKNQETVDARIECIERELPGLVSDVVFCNFGSCKSDLLAKMPPSIFMDDLFSVCQNVSQKSDHLVFLINQKYNSKPTKNDHSDLTFNRINSPLDLPIFKQ